MATDGTLRGRPRLEIRFTDIVEAVRRRGQVVAAGRDLGCSPAYVHKRLKDRGLTLRQVLLARSELELLKPVASHRG